MADRRIPIPHDSTRGCLCKSGNYSKSCCGQSQFSQGIGSITKSTFSLLLEDGGRMLQEDNTKIIL
tara:strand:+ start:3308 stop:3505 length:198 start_codon:yes stop_codon:yes gene_type:complete